MKIDFSDVKMTPPNMPFGLCVYGKPNDKIQEWINYWGFKTAISGNFTNILGVTNYEEVFNCHTPFEYMDGFSPNLNKNLHLGHVSNFVLANAYQKMDISKKTVCILGDTLSGDVSNQEAFDFYKDFCNKHNYKIDEVYFASEQVLKNTDFLLDGENDYEGTKVFLLNDGSKIVGVKEDGSTTYFYQDVALSQTLGKPTLYITGNEQENHFNNLKKISSNVNHVGLGLVLLDGEKMSSRKGNVIYLTEMFDILNKEFNNDQLSYNVLAGHFLKSNPASNKNVKLKDLSNPKTSTGLYFSYTLARLQSAGVSLESTELKGKLKFVFLKSQKELNSSLLIKELLSIANSINALYTTHKIVGNEENKLMFKEKGDQLLSGMEKIGMYNIKKV